MNKEPKIVDISYEPWEFIEFDNNHFLVWVLNRRTGEVVKRKVKDETE